jgi:hypothetical protein
VPALASRDVHPHRALDRGADALRRILQEHVSRVRSVQMSGARDGRGQVACVGDWGCQIGSAAEDDRVRGDRLQCVLSLEEFDQYPAVATEP